MTRWTTNQCWWPDLSGWASHEVTWSFVDCCQVAEQRRSSQEEQENDRTNTWQKSVGAAPQASVRFMRSYRYGILELFTAFRDKNNQRDNLGDKSACKVIMNNNQFEEHSRCSQYTCPNSFRWRATCRFLGLEPSWMEPENSTSCSTGHVRHICFGPRWH